MPTIWKESINEDEFTIPVFLKYRKDSVKILTINLNNTVTKSGHSYKIKI